MREIKFRAKAIENFETHIDSIEIGDWVYGYYYFDRANMTGIIVTDLLEESGCMGSGIMQCHIKVDPETVGEYSGLSDKNGKEIYGEDITSIKEHMNPLVEIRKAIVTWDKETTGFLGIGFFPWNMVEVIGNIYENPELLEAK